MNLLHNTPNQKFRTRYKWWVEINDGTYNINLQIKFRDTTLNSSLYELSDKYIFAKGNITDGGTSATAAAADNANEKVIFKNCDSAKDLDVVIPVDNLFGSSQWHCRDELTEDNNGEGIDFADNNTTDSIKFKEKKNKLGRW